MVRHSKLVRKGAFELCHRMIGQLAMGKSKLVQLNNVWVVEKKLSLADHRKWNSDFFFIFGSKFSQPERFLFPFFRVMTVDLSIIMLMLQLGTLAGQGEGGERVWFSIAVILAYGECIDVKVRYLYQPVWKKKKLKTCLLIPTTGFQMFWNRH